MTWRPRLDPGREIGYPLAMLLVGVAFAAIGTLFPRDHLPFVVAWIGFSGLFVLVCLYEAAVALRRVLAPTERVVAVVMADLHRPSSLTPHRVSLQLAGGREREVIAPDPLMNLVGVHDIGIAYIQRDQLVDYRWFDVMPAELPAGALPRAPSCPHCAAPLTLETVARCLFCGEALPEPALGAEDARFAAASASPAVRDALATPRPPSLPPLTGPLVVLILGGLLAGLMWQLRVVFVLFYEDWSWGFLFLIPPIMLLCSGAIWLRRRAALRRGKPQRLVARVLRRRKVVVVTVNGRPARWAYFVTLASPSGGRTELRCMPDVAALALDESIGVAEVRPPWLASYVPVRDVLAT